MEYFVKEFTAVDFLGILTPGCVFLILANDLLPVSAALRNYFGESDFVAFDICFIVGGYLVGSIFHQLGSVLSRRILRVCSVCSKEIGWNSRTSDGFYCKLLRFFDSQVDVFMGLSTEEQNKLAGGIALSNTAEYTIEEIHKIYGHVFTVAYRKRSFGKRQLFEGFHIASRSLCMVMLVVLLMNCIPQKTASASCTLLLNEWFYPWEVAVAFFIVFLLLLSREYSYIRLINKYAVEDYVELKK